MNKNNEFIKLSEDTSIVSFNTEVFSTMYSKDYINTKMMELGSQLDGVSLDSGFSMADPSSVLMWFQYVDKGINRGIEELKDVKEYRCFAQQLAAPLKNIEFGKFGNVLGDIETAKSSKQLLVALVDAREFLHLLIYRIVYFPLRDNQGQSMMAVAA